MELRIETHGDICILRPAGRITFADGDQEIGEVVRTQMSRGARKILIDFGRVRAIDWSGIGELVGCAVYIKERRGEMKLCGLDPRCFDLMKMTSLHALFEVEETGLEALAAFW